MKLATLAAFLGTTALVPLSALAQQQSPAPQPNITAQGQQQGQSQQRQSGQQQTQQAQSGQQQNQGLRASQLRNQTLYTQSGQQIGRVNTLVRGRDNQTYAVVDSGNGQGLVPANRLAYRNNRFIITGADDQLRFQTYNQQVAGQYRELDAEARVAIVGYDVDPVVAARSVGDGTNVLVRQPAPVVQVDPADPRVIVNQPQPRVTVNQQQPEILVRQPQPTVEVNIPQPEIIVRMPQPDVNVAMAQPNVRVLTARPDVQVARPGEPQVQVEEVQPQVIMQQQANAQPQVQVQRAGEPVVRYERAEPRVVVNQAEGQPNVRFEQQGQPNVRVQQQAQNEQRMQRQNQRVGAVGADVNEIEPRRDPIDTGVEGATGAIGNAAVRPFRVSDLEDMEVYSLRGQQIGEVKRVVRRIGDNQGYIVLEHGGFLGLGEKEVPLPMNRVFLMGDRLVAAGMTEAEINAIQDWDFNDREYTEVGDNETLEIGVRG